jgi:hypothetical protein
MTDAEFGSRTGLHTTTANESADVGRIGGRWANRARRDRAGCAEYPPDAGAVVHAGGLFIGGLAVGAIGYFLAPPLVLLAGILFFLGFVVDLTYEIWAVKEARYGTLRSAIGVYIAVMGVFIHVLQWVRRVLETVES